MQVLYSVIFQIEFERKKNKRWKLEFKKMKSKEEYFSLRLVCLVASSNVSHANQSELQINALLKVFREKKCWITFQLKFLTS